MVKSVTSASRFGRGKYSGSPACFLVLWVPHGTSTLAATEHYEPDGLLFAGAIDLNYFFAANGLRSPPLCYYTRDDGQGLPSKRMQALDQNRTLPIPIMIQTGRLVKPITPKSL